VAAVSVAIVALAMVAWWAWPVTPVRLAILPFENIDGDAKDQVAAAGFRELLIGQLTSVERPGGLLVIAPSPEEVKNKQIEGPEQAQSRLGANLVMIGKLVRGGGQPQLIVHLLDPRTLEERSGEKVDLSGGGWAVSAAKIVRLLNLGASARFRLALNSPHSGNPQAERSYVEGEGLLHSGESEAAESAFGDATKQDPEFALAWAGLADAQFERFRQAKDAGSLNEAAANAQRALKLNPRLAAAHVALGQILLAQENPAAAKQQLQTALQIEPSNASALQALGSAYRDLNSYNDALAAYSLAIAMRPDDASSYNRLGHFYEDQNKPELLPEAERNYLAAIKRAPDSYIAHYNLGGVYLKMERYEDAFREFEKSLLIAPSLSGYNDLGTWYYYAKQFGKAAEKYKRATELAPSNYKGWGNLADAYRWDPSQADKAPGAFHTAITLLEKEIAARPDSPRLHAQMAAYYVSIRSPEPRGALTESDRRQALEEIGKALSLAPGQAAVQFFAALVYEQVDERAKALAAIKQMLTSGPDMMFYVARAPAFERLRADSEFIRMAPQVSSGNDHRN
jgi:serine/threonine-protein kinase